MSITKICVISLAAVFLTLQFKQIKNEYTILIMIASSALIFYFSVEKIAFVINLVKKLANSTGLKKDYILLMVKVVGISFLCQITSDICKDNGMQTLSSQVETFGKIGILVSGLPLMSGMIDTIVNLL